MSSSSEDDTPITELNKIPKKVSNNISTNILNKPPNNPPNNPTNNPTNNPLNNPPNNIVKQNNNDDDDDDDDDIPIQQLRTSAKMNPPLGSNSANCSQKPSLNASNENNKNNDASYGNNSESSEDDKPLVPKHNPNNDAHTKNGDNLTNSKKRKKKFLDSDDDFSPSSSDGGTPILGTAKIEQPVPKKKPQTIPKKSAKKNTIKKNNKVNSKHDDDDYDINSDIKENGVSPRKKSMIRPSFVGREVNDPKKYRVKQEVKPLQTDKNAMKWWDRLDELSEERRWVTLDHNGIVFAPPYVAHNVKMTYDGKDVTLTPDQEELATMYAMMIESEFVKRDKFNKNFMKEFRKVLCDKTQSIQHPEIVDIAKCDFRSIYQWYQTKKEEEKVLRKDNDFKEKLKKEKDHLNSIYGFAIVDGVKERVGNYKVEPPGLFRGRGEHPKMGLLKKRLMPEDIILNIGENMEIPPCPIPGHQWGGVIHDHAVTYIAKWVENINGQHKFIYLHASSRFKGESDMRKFEKARELKKHVVKIREDYTAKLTSKDLTTRQLATAIWIIDHLSIRVGNEKDTDEEADTVGVCSLRCEHIRFHDSESKDENNYQITLDFLGKDSMRYLQTVKIPKLIFRNLQSFVHGKKCDQNIFEKIDPPKVNLYLSNMMDGLTAKVFRTHNASVCLQQELTKNEHPKVGKITKDSLLADKLFFYNQCNMQVAILCNHQKSVSKTHTQQLEKIDQNIKELKDGLQELEDELQVALGNAKPSILKDPTKRVRDVERLQTFIENKKRNLRQKELTKALKGDAKEVALGTSKINYMDPRISVAWCKNFEVPIEKVFNNALLEKFPWAMAAVLAYNF